MQVLQRISAWGLLAGWLVLAFAAKTLRGDAAGLWILLEPILLIGIGLLLISSIGVYAALFSSRAADRRQPSQADTEK
jgi:ABC-type antimicrobial peptide transport system permease subunit